VFGFGGYDTELLSVQVVREGSVLGRDGRTRLWSVIYRVHQRLTVKAIDGAPVGSFDGVAIGSAVNVSSLAEAHDLAVKEADSQALKRAAVNLGDQFGLSLYDNGALAPVVRWAAPYEVRYEGDDEAATAGTPVPAEAPGTGVAEPTTEAEAPQRDYLQEVREAPDAATAWGIRREASKAGAGRPYLDELAVLARSKPKCAPGVGEPSPGSAPAGGAPADGDEASGHPGPVSPDTGPDASGDTGREDVPPVDTRSAGPDVSGPDLSDAWSSGPDVSGGGTADGWDTVPGAAWATPPGGDPWASPADRALSDAEPDPDHAEAVKELTAAAADRDMDAEAEVFARWGVPLDDAPAADIRRLTDELRSPAARPHHDVGPPPVPGGRPRPRRTSMTMTLQELALEEAALKAIEETV
jgi:hypothetical protein